MSRTLEPDASSHAASEERRDDGRFAAAVLGAMAICFAATISYLVLGIVGKPPVDDATPAGDVERTDVGLRGLFEDYPLATGSYVPDSTHVAIGIAGACVTAWLLLVTGALLRDAPWARRASAVTAALLAGFWSLVTWTAAVAQVSGIGHMTMFTVVAVGLNSCAAWSGAVSARARRRGGVPRREETSSGPPAAFAARIFARGLDLSIYGFVVAPLVGALYELLADSDVPEWLSTAHTVFAVAIALAFETMTTAWGGQTPGKMVLGIRVVGDDGEPLGGARAGARVVLWAIGLALPYGLVVYAHALVDRRRRFLYDRVARSQAVWARPAPMRSREPAS